MIFTFAGAGYVLLNHGQVNAGYAIVPMSFTLVWIGVYSGRKKDDKNDK